MTVKTKPVTKPLSIYEFERTVAELDEAFKQNEQAVNQLNSVIDDLNKLAESRLAKKTKQ